VHAICATNVRKTEKDEIKPEKELINYETIENVFPSIERDKKSDARPVLDMEIIKQRYEICEPNVEGRSEDTSGDQKTDEIEAIGSKSTFIDINDANEDSTLPCR